MTKNRAKRNEKSDTTTSTIEINTSLPTQQKIDFFYELEVGWIRTPLSYTSVARHSHHSSPLLHFSHENDCLDGIY